MLVVQAKPQRAPVSEMGLYNASLQAFKEGGW